ncbi:PEGA domain-containing protein, partial [Desulfobulbus sp. TB]|nr:PEGA domain-containing protein [Desulfobulbus sp. TB]
RYRLQITKQGFKPVRQDIFLADDEEISIHLEEMYTLTVYADMEESRVLLDGNIVGTAGRNPLELSLKTGEYALGLTNPSVAKPFQKKILLQGDQVIRAEFPHPRLTIRTNINDAIVAVADKEYQIQGKELVLKLPFGRHQLIIRKSGYSPVVHEVVIQQQDQVLPITLEGTTYHLSIIPNVANSTISVSCANEQKYFGTASPGKPFQVKTSAQSCNVFAEKQGYQRVNQKISLIADQELPLTLQKLFLLKVYTDLDRSIIVLDGKEVGKSDSKTPAVLSLLSGTYVLTASHPLALAPVQQKIRLTKDRRLDIKLPLPQLTVKVNVAGVMLLIDQDKHLDKQYDKKSRKKQWIAGRQVTLRLTRGSHHITAQKKGYITMQRQVLVQDSTQTSFKLVPEVYPLSIRSNVDKTAIYVKCKDGKEYTGLASPRVPFQLEAVAGTCTVSATLAGYNNIKRTVILPSEKNLSLHLSVGVKVKVKTQSALHTLQAPQTLQIRSTSKVKPATSFEEERKGKTKQVERETFKLIKTLLPRKKKEKVKSESKRRREFIRPVRNPISKSTTRSRRNTRRKIHLISVGRTQSAPLPLLREAKKKTVKMNSVLVCQSYAIDI